MFAKVKCEDHQSSCVRYMVNDLKVIFILSNSCKENIIRVCLLSACVERPQKLDRTSPFGTEIVRDVAS